MDNNCSSYSPRFKAQVALEALRRAFGAWFGNGQSVRKRKSGE